MSGRTDSGAENTDVLLAATAQAGRRHFWFRAFRRFVRPLLVRATAGLARPRLLDCGCGTGANLPLLAEFGEAFGIDYAWSGLVLARADGDLRVAQATAAALPFPSESFDVVTSFDVLVTLPDAVERRALAEMARVLRPGGGAVVNVAAFDWLRGHHSVLSNEVRRYTRGTLRAAVEAAGFDVLSMTYTNAMLVPIVAPRRFVQRMGGLQARADDMRPLPAPVNAALSAALGVEAAIARHVSLPVGTSLLALARKT